MSETSERVGLSLVIMESIISVDKITGFPSRLHLRIIYFCMKAMSSIQNSKPSWPLAITMPSAASLISSKLASAFLDCNFARSLMCRPLTDRSSFTSLISSLVSTPLTETKSTPNLMSELMIMRSLLSTTGRSKTYFKSTSGRQIALPEMISLSISAIHSMTLGSFFFSAAFGFTLLLLPPGLAAGFTTFDATAYTTGLLTFGCSIFG